MSRMQVRSGACARNRFSALMAKSRARTNADPDAPAARMRSRLPRNSAFSNSHFEAGSHEAASYVYRRLGEN